MNISRMIALAVVPLALAAAPAPAGSDAKGCGLPSVIADAGIRASFEQFDRTQSAAAAKVCALYLNTMDGAVSD